MKKKISDIQPGEVFLRQATLKGYRTVKNTKIDFKPGLNIVIGQNGVGKSNFLHYLRNSLSFDIQPFSTHDANLLFSLDLPEHANAPVTVEIDIKKKIGASLTNGTPTVKTDDTLYRLKREDQDQLQFENYQDFDRQLDQEQLLYSTVFISHGIPEKYPLISEPLSFKVQREGDLEENSPLLLAQKNSQGLRNVFSYIIYSLMLSYLNSKNSIPKNLDSIILDTEKQFAPVEAALKKYTDIKGIRFNKNYYTFFDNKSSELSVSNLLMEFKVKGDWFPFHHLSDGTRRLFYIINEISFPMSILYHNSGWRILRHEIPKIILLEEPELGLHPRQLDALLHFIDEASNQHQIILTTHAPQVLDILGKDRLEHIILAKLTAKGTKLRHMTKKEKEKAALYMDEEAYLSDYWRFSDLDG